MKKKLQIAIIGGGPSSLFMFKRLLEPGIEDIVIDIFEKRAQLGAGLPYSTAGAGDEHITNVSANEIPSLVTPIAEWIKTVPAETLEHFHIDEKFNDYKVLPRLLFGHYLSDQFELLLTKAGQQGIDVQVHFENKVTDVRYENELVTVAINGADKSVYDIAVICTGHYWPLKHEGKIAGYFDSPYPPAKLDLKLNHAIAIRGSSLTAVDAVRTLARHHGHFHYDEGKTTYALDPAYPDFKMVLHTRHGMLPAVRFNLDNSHLENKRVLTPEQIAAHIAANDGFLALDFIFEKDFKELFRDKEPEFYKRISPMNMEEFVDEMMALRERLDPFLLLKAEYAEAEQSIKRKQSVYWKELLGVLSFAMNYPAKHLSAEDMQRLQKVLLPLISIVIAYIPQSSAEQLIALHAAGVLDIIAVGDDSEVEPVATGGAIYCYDDQTVYFKTLVDCTGQPHLDYGEFPFKGLLKAHAITPARLKFRQAENGKNALAGGAPVGTDAAGDHYLHVSGVAINDAFQVIDAYGAYNKHLYLMAVPYIGGFNPDYSGLDFCEAASKAIIEQIKNYEST